MDTARNLAMHLPRWRLGALLVALLCIVSLTRAHAQDGEFSPLAMNGTNGISGDDVRALAWAGSDLYIGGTFTTAGGIAANYVVQWNGTTFSPLVMNGVSGVDSFVNSLAWTGSEL